MKYCLIALPLDLHLREAECQVRASAHASRALDLGHAAVEYGSGRKHGEPVNDNRSTELC